jgi:hypothetical protein
MNDTIADGEGWNLVGNPFPSAVDWDHPSWVRENIEGSIYVFDGTQYLVWSGGGGFGTLTDGIIPAMQSFFIKANNFDPLLTINNESRMHGVDSYKQSTIENLLVLSVEGNGYNDETFIHFNDLGRKEYDPEYDAYKLKGIAEAPQLYSMSEGDILSVNVLPQLHRDTSISFGLEVGKSTEYVIIASMLESFHDTADIFLEDKLEDIIVDLKDQSTYRFTASPFDNIDRFLVHFGKSDQFKENDLKSEDYLVIYSNEHSIYIRSMLDSSISIDFILYTISGQEIERDRFWINDMIVLTPEVNTGFYIVKIVTPQKIFTQRVFLK